jgi:hypothetical protein
VRNFGLVKENPLLVHNKSSVYQVPCSLVLWHSAATDYCILDKVLLHSEQPLITSNTEAMCLMCSKSTHSRVVTMPLLHALASHTMLANYIWHHPILQIDFEALP